MRIPTTICAAACLICLLPVRGESTKPKLVLVLSVDQMRSDFIPRFAGRFGEAVKREGRAQSFGGFGHLLHDGAWFADAKHAHYPLFTGPGHAVQLTGAHPYKSGIVGNYWFDAHEKKGRKYCVEDRSQWGAIIGRDGELSRTNLTPVSPVALEASTVGDELRIATANRAKVWGLALKDRASVLMAGHLANGALWFDEETGDWISSRYYFTNGALPGWVQKLNGEVGTAGKRLVDTYTNRVWQSSTDDPRRIHWTGHGDFRHEQAGPGYKEFSFTPYANEFVLQTARKLIEAEGLGGDETPDLLALNFSSNDYVGHRHGADSAEVAEITVELDRQLGSFFAWLEERIGLAKVLIVLTSDHGASPYPKQAHAEAHFDADIADEREIEKLINQQIAEWHGRQEPEAKAATLVEYNLYLHSDALRDKPVLAELRERVAGWILNRREFGYAEAYTRDQILSGRLPRTDVAERVMKGYSRMNSGDVVLVPRQFWVHLDPKYKYKTSHGSPYNYDTAVPLLIAGPGIRKGKVLDPVSTLDIAPTLSHLLGILPPSGSEGRILKHALE